MNLTELFAYKNELMKILCSSEKINGLLAPSTKDGKVLAYQQIFPYEYIPETVTEGKSFLCFDMDVPHIFDKTFLSPQLHVWVFCHKSLMRLPTGGVRTDHLAIEINTLLNGNRKFGLGELELKSAHRFSPIKEYLGRSLTYEAKEFNRPAHIRKDFLP